MNTYHKFCPNVFVAKCTEPHEKGDIIPVTTKYGKENDSIVFNLVGQRDGYYYYSIIREDGFNVQEWAKRRAERLIGAAATAEKTGEAYYQRSNKDKDFLSLGEPIKIGHHSERRHRKVIQEAQDNFRRFMEADKKAETYKERAEYWQAKASTINLSMPESIEYFAYKLEKAQRAHAFLKEHPEARIHSYSLTYAKKEVNEAQKALDLAIKLWG